MENFLLTLEQYESDGRNLKCTELSLNNHDRE